MSEIRNAPRTLALSERLAASALGGMGKYGAMREFAVLLEHELMIALQTIDSLRHSENQQPR